MKKIFGTIAFIAAFFLSFIDGFAAATTFVVIAGTPQAVTADYYNNIVSGLDLNIIKYLPKLYARYGNQGADFLDTLRAMGYERTDSVETINHFEENWIHQSFKVLISTAGAAGAAKTLTIHPDSLDSSNRFYPRVSDTLTFPNEVTGQIISISVAVPSAPTITVVPWNVAKAIPACAAGQPLAITGNAFSEGSTQPLGRFSGAWKYTNYMQIVKESMGASGTQLTNESWVKVADGKNIEGWANKGLMDEETRMKITIQGTFLTQELNTNPLAVDNLNSGAAETTTEGFFPYLKRVGIPYPYAPGTWTVQDFNTIERLQSRQYSNRDVLMMMGQDIDIENEDVLKDYNSNTNIILTAEAANNRLFGDSPEGKALGVSVNFQWILKAGRRYAFKRFEAMNNPQTYGAAGYTYPSKFSIFPLGMNKDKKNPSKELPAIGVVWKGMGDKQRKLAVWDYGAAEGGPKMGAQDRRDWYMRSEFSTEFFGGNQMVDGFAQ